MTSGNGSDHLSQLEGLVLSLAKTFGQAQQQQQTFNQQISERLSEFIEQSNENFQTLTEAHRVTEHQIAALVDAQGLTNESIGSLTENTTSLSNSVQSLAQTVETVVARIDEMQAEVKGLQTENRRILDHLFGQQNGGQPE